MRSIGRRMVSVVTIYAVLLALIAWPCQQALANGGAPQLTRVRAGPYIVSVWTQPATPRVGALDVSVAVMQPQDGALVLDAVVRLTATLVKPPGGTITTIATTGAGGNRLLSHANLELDEAGRWRIAVVVRGPDGEGEAAFEIQARPPRRLWWLLAGVIASVAVMWVAWHVWRKEA